MKKRDVHVEKGCTKGKRMLMRRDAHEERGHTQVEDVHIWRRNVHAERGCDRGEGMHLCRRHAHGKKRCAGLHSHTRARGCAQGHEERWSPVVQPAAAAWLRHRGGTAHAVGCPVGQLQLWGGGEDNGRLSPRAPSQGCTWDGVRVPQPSPVLAALSFVLIKGWQGL